MPEPVGTMLTKTQFEDLYARFGSRLHSYILNQVSDSETAADLAQDVFVRVLRCPFEFRVENEAVGYLYRTAFSVVMDHFRREKRAHFWDFAAPASRPMNPDLSTDVERAFDQLKMKDRTLLWLAYIEEMTHSEIAAIIKVKEGSVKVLLSRARNRMESSLKKHGVSAEEFA